MKHSSRSRRIGRTAWVATLLATAAFGRSSLAREPTQPPPAAPAQQEAPSVSLRGIEDAGAFSLYVNEEPLLTNEFTWSAEGVFESRSTLSYGGQEVEYSLSIEPDESGAWKRIEYRSPVFDGDATRAGAQVPDPRHEQGHERGEHGHRRAEAGARPVRELQPRADGSRRPRLRRGEGRCAGDPHAHHPRRNHRHEAGVPRDRGTQRRRSHAVVPALRVRVPGPGDLPVDRRERTPVPGRGSRPALELRPRRLRGPAAEADRRSAPVAAGERGRRGARRSRADARRRRALDRRLSPRGRGQAPAHPHPHALQEGDAGAAGALLRATRVRGRGPGRARSIRLAGRVGALRERGRGRPRLDRMARGAGPGPPARSG